MHKRAAMHPYYRRMNAGDPEDDEEEEEEEKESGDEDEDEDEEGDEDEEEEETWRFVPYRARLLPVPPAAGQPERGKDDERAGGEQHHGVSAPIAEFGG